MFASMGTEWILKIDALLASVSNDSSFWAASLISKILLLVGKNSRPKPPFSETLLSADKQT